MKVCHIRGEEDYWVTANHKYHYCRVRDESPIVDTWNECCNINYYEFRYRVRNIIIDSIAKSNHFDKICVNNTTFYDFIEGVNDEQSILYYAQDDDDLYLYNDINKFCYLPGVYHPSHTKIDPSDFIRKTREQFYDNIRNRKEIEVNYLHFPGYKGRNTSLLIVDCLLNLRSFFNLKISGNYDSHLLTCPTHKVYIKYLSHLKYFKSTNWDKL